MIVRIPTDISLERYIRELVKKDEVWKFYKTDDWLELKEDVLEYYHYECQGCLKKGQYTRAECVHHVNHVRKKPSLALSRYYIDKKGQTQPNLLPLCNICHNLEHPEKFKNYYDKDKFTNEERW